MVDGRETVGNSLGRAPLEGSDTEPTTGWTEGKTVGNSLGRASLGGSDTEATTGTDGRPWDSLGRAPLGGSDTEATTGWTDGKPWEIAWGELCWEGAARKRRQDGRTGNPLLYTTLLLQLQIYYATLHHINYTTLH